MGAIFKRIFDFISVLIGGFIISPLLVYVAYRIKKDSPGSAIYDGERIGKVDAIVCISGDFEWEREKATAQLYEKHKVPVIMSGYKEDIIKRLAKQGIPEDKLTFDKAFNTKENVQFTLPVVKAKGYKKVYLVSSANHMPRSMMNFEIAYKSNGVEVVAWPVGYYTGKVHRGNHPFDGWSSLCILLELLEGPLRCFKQEMNRKI